MIRRQVHRRAVCGHTGPAGRQTWVRAKLPQRPGGRQRLAEPQSTRGECHYWKLSTHIDFLSTVMLPVMA